jgi:hypothetical protein
MVWNNKDWKVPWVKDIEDILTRYYDDTPRAVTYKWKDVIEKYTHFRCVRHDILPGTLLKVRKTSYKIFHDLSVFSHIFCVTQRSGHISENLEKNSTVCFTSTTCRCNKNVFSKDEYFFNAMFLGNKNKVWKTYQNIAATSDCWNFISSWYDDWYGRFIETRVVFTKDTWKIVWTP